MIEWLFEQSVALTCLVLVIWLVNRLMGKRLGAITIYWLWSLIPVSILASWLPKWHLSDVKLGHLLFNLQESVKLQESLGGQAVSAVSLSQIVLYMWLAGVILLLAALFVSHVSYIRRLNTHHVNTEIVNASLSANNVKTSVRYSNHISSPFLIGIFKPRLILPANFTADFSMESQRLILAHEMVHVKRGDLIWNGLAQLVLLLFWFNPLMWWAYRMFRQHQELACDQTVVAGLNKSMRMSYAQTMLKCSSAASTHLQPTLISYGAKNMLKQRLENLKQHQAVKWWKPLAALGLMIPLIVGVNTVNANTEMEYQKPIFRVVPSYPKEAAKAGTTGYVVLVFDITLDGKPDNISIVEQQPGEVFGKAAMKALKKWRFVPDREMVLKNKAVRIDFQLEQSKDSK